VRKTLLAMLIVAPAIAIARPSSTAVVAPKQASLDDRVAANVRCESCHTEIAEQWRGSLHRASFTDDAFTRALAREPDPFCRGCHAPEANPIAPEADRASIGVACVTCHGTDHASMKTKPARACESCHEFDFPDGDARTHPLAMQKTATEHESGPFASTSCVDCHTPHRVSASRDVAMLRAAVEIDAQRVDGGVEIVLATSQAIGHAFPTGDLFRRISVFVEADGVVPQVRRLGRRFAMREEIPGVPIRVEIADDRSDADAPRVVFFPLVAAPVARWRVVYERVAFPKPSAPLEAEVDGSIVVAAGTL
jgi:hypothetical protein